MTVVHLDVELCCVFEYQIVYLGKVAVNESYEVWTRVALREKLFVVEEEQHPPMVASSIYLPSPMQRDMRTAPEGEEVFEVGGYIMLPRPVPYIFGGDEFALELDRDVVEILYADWHGVVFVVGDTDGSIRFGGVGCVESTEDGLLVFELVGDRVGVGHCSEVGDVEQGQREGQQQAQSY